MFFAGALIDAQVDLNPHQVGSRKIHEKGKTKMNLRDLFLRIL